MENTVVSLLIDLVYLSDLVWFFVSYNTFGLILAKETKFMLSSVRVCVCVGCVCVWYFH